jgi:hypothetical protein
MEKKVLNKKEVILSLANKRSISEIQATVNLLFIEEEGFTTTNVSFRYFFASVPAVLQNSDILKSEKSTI